ncbi:MAG: FkbM family methyltransferase [Bryobacteraceae bacterium]
MIQRIARRIASNRPLRQVLIPLFQRLNPGDITIRHHWTGEAVRLHAFRHKGYWFYGGEREKRSMLFIRVLIAADDVVLDVGGHIGYMAMYFGSLVGPHGRVFTFEPGTNNLPYIRRNVSHARYSNVLLVEKAVGAENGFTRFFLEDITGQNNSLLQDYPAFRLNAMSHGLVPRVAECQVQVVTLDSFVEHTRVQPRFIKIDVEGAEYLVLRGMQRILAADRPFLMVEITHQSDEVFQVLRHAGYVLLDEQKRTIQAISDLAGAGPNFFALPAERTAVLSRLALQ